MQISDPYYLAMRKRGTVRNDRTVISVLSLFLLVFVSSISSLIAKENRFKTWNTENGLPQNSVIAIAQTRDGYVLAGYVRGARAV